MAVVVVVVLFVLLMWVVLVATTVEDPRKVGAVLVTVDSPRRKGWDRRLVREDFLVHAVTLFLNVMCYVLRWFFVMVMMDLLYNVSWVVMHRDGIMVMMRVVANCLSNYYALILFFLLR
jgi:hypothetical protein